MCGIFGHIGKKGSISQCMSGLRFLEYRGYDSLGVAGVEEGQLVVFKEKGHFSELEKALGNGLNRSELTIGHTRWATHGKVTKVNAHPHFDQESTLAIVHNGIIENYALLREMLGATGRTFVSETDTEVVAQLIAHYYEGDLLVAVQKAMNQCEGFWGLAVLHVNHPDQIIVTRNESPIVVGFSEDGENGYVSSDPQAISENALRLYYLKNREIAKIHRDKIELYDHTLTPLYREFEPYSVPMREFDKEGFEHFMLKEIFEQPLAIRRALEGRLDREKEEIILPVDDEFFVGAEEILFIGCGSAAHAGLIAALQVESICGIPARAEVASEFRYRDPIIGPHTRVIALSQSGETFDTIGALKKAKDSGAKVLAICNAPGSTLTREADETILLNAGAEISVCSTKAFVSMLVVLSLVVLRFAGRTEGRFAHLFQQLLALPSIVEAVLAEADAIADISKRFSDKQHAIFLGRQYMYPSALESALKLKEISYLSASGYAAGELKHGPIALIDPSYLVVGLCGSNKTYEKTLSNLTEVKARDGTILAFAPHGSHELEMIADTVHFLPAICDELAPIPYNVATQLLAYFIAKERNAEIDRPRNLAKSVTVE